MFCKKKNTPHNFHVTIVIALEHWVRDQTPLEMIQASSAVHKLHHAQRQIGWTRFLRGFLSQQWRDYLEYELNHNQDAPAPDHFDYNHFFSGLIKVMWEQQTKFWMEFQQGLHHNTTSEQPPAKTEEYRLEVRHLYGLRDQVLPQHRDEYFPQKLSDYLDNSTSTQLQNYITNYKPAIRRSIREARRRSTNSRPIYQFPGFQRHHQPRHHPETTPAPNASNTQQHPANTTANSLIRGTLDTTAQALRRTFAQTTLLGAFVNTNLTRNTRERPPHKHSRWKPLRAAQDRFQAFFTNTNQTQDTNNQKDD
jgi:hypothetical protein